jgi:hypothetical protein
MEPMKVLSRAWKWLTRAYRYEFDVVRPFIVIEAISGAQRQFKAGDSVLCGSASQGSTVMFELDGVFFTVEQPVFQACCEPRQPVTMPS